MKALKFKFHCRRLKYPEIFKCIRSRTTTNLAVLFVCLFVFVVILVLWLFFFPVDLILSDFQSINWSTDMSFHRLLTLFLETGFPIFWWEEVWYFQKTALMLSPPQVEVTENSKCSYISQTISRKKSILTQGHDRNPPIYSSYSLLFLYYSCLSFISLSSTYYVLPWFQKGLEYMRQKKLDIAFFFLNYAF